MKVNDTRKLKDRICIIAIGIILGCINFAILQLASMRYILDMHIAYWFINIGVIAAFVGILYGFIGKMWVSELIFSLGCAIYSIVNQYVMEFHGSPLTIPEFSNAQTAINVLGCYSILSMKPLVLSIAIVFLAVVMFFLIKLLKKYETHIEGAGQQRTRKIVMRIVISLCGTVYMVVILSAARLYEPIQSCWLYKEAVGRYGYPLYFLQSGFEYEVSAPVGYSEEILSTIPIDNYLYKTAENNQTPDIILIMNESFYDISLVSDVETDVEYMGHFLGMDNSISGYAVVPKIGGGTNNSEYELLTSNSTYLMQEITPFQTLDMSNTASIVSNLKEQGYYSIGMHPAPAGNYSRNTGYLRLGFDEIHFEDDFINKEYYGNRKLVTDACAYDYMVQWYERAIQEDKPVFSYLLTIQNHGDWTTNEADDDIVHAQNYNNPKYQDKLNEYLSCISLSVKALDELIDYFRNSERPVIVCMVGDHSPTFIGSVANKDLDNDIYFRATPFMIWANFPIEEKENVFLSLNELGPLLLDTAGVQMIPYYQYVLQLSREVPVLTSYGRYMAADGNIFSYTDDTEYSTNIQKYFFLEYNNLQKVSRSQWFRVN